MLLCSTTNHPVALKCLRYWVLQSRITYAQKLEKFYWLFLRQMNKVRNKGWGLWFRASSESPALSERQVQCPAQKWKRKPEAIIYSNSTQHEIFHFLIKEACLSRYLTHLCMLFSCLGLPSGNHRYCHFWVIWNSQGLCNFLSLWGCFGVGNS